MTPKNHSSAPIFVGLFYSLASLTCAAAGVSILLPESALRGMWTLKPVAYQQLLAMSPWSGAGFCVLATVMMLTSVGCLRRKRWGWILAMGIFAVNVVADAARLLAGQFLEGLIGASAAGAIVYVLSRPNARRAFDR